MWHVRVPKGFSRATLERKAWRLRHPPEYTSRLILVSLWELLVTHRLDREAHSWPQGTRAWPAEGRGRPLPSQSSASATAGPHRRVPQNRPPTPGLAQLLSVTDRPRLIVPRRCYSFYKLNARPSTSKKVVTRFTATLAVLGGLEPSQRYL